MNIKKDINKDEDSYDYIKELLEDYKYVRNKGDYLEERHTLEREGNLKHSIEYNFHQMLHLINRLDTVCNMLSKDNVSGAYSELTMLKSSLLDKVKEVKM